MIKLRFYNWDGKDSRTCTIGPHENVRIERANEIVVWDGEEICVAYWSESLKAWNIYPSGVDNPAVYSNFDSFEIIHD